MTIWVSKRLRAVRICVICARRAPFSQQPFMARSVAQRRRNSSVLINNQYNMPCILFSRESQGLEIDAMSDVSLTGCEQRPPPMFWSAWRLVRPSRNSLSLARRLVLLAVRYCRLSLCHWPTHPAPDSDPETRSIMMAY